jgi:hypothetical protein
MEMPDSLGSKPRDFLRKNTGRKPADAGQPFS